MTESTKIEFRCRRIRQIGDITDLVTMLFPGNQNQQHAAARILLVLRATNGVTPSLGSIEREHGISRRTIERTRAKLARLGVIERITWMNSRYGGQQGWRLSSGMSGSLRQLADKLDSWRADKRSERREKDEQLVGLLR